MGFGSINWLTVVVCVLAAMISGWIWFSPGVFFPAWWKGIGREGTPGMGDYGNLSMGVTWGLTILSSVVQGVFAVLFIPMLANALGGLSLATGLQAGFWLWLGIVAPTNLVNKLFVRDLLNESADIQPVHLAGDKIRVEDGAVEKKGQAENGERNKQQEAQNSGAEGF